MKKAENTEMCTYYKMLKTGWTVKVTNEKIVKWINEDQEKLKEEQLYTWLYPKYKTSAAYYRRRG